MKLSWLLPSFVLVVRAVSATTIHSLQYTEIPGPDGTYPSLLEGSVVTVSGVVSAVNYFSHGFLLSSPEGGPWNAVLVWDDQNYMPQKGDRLQVTGRVTEYQGMTEINQVQERLLLETGCPLPEPAEISGAECGEPFESVLVVERDLEVTAAPDEYGYWRVDDGSGETVVGGIFHTPEAPPQPGDTFSALAGIVAWRYGRFTLNPRAEEDILPGADATSVAAPSGLIPLGEDAVLAVTVSPVSPDWEWQQFSGVFRYPETLLQLDNVLTEGTLSAGGQLQWWIPQPGRLEVNWNGPTLSGAGALLKLDLQGLAAGSDSLVPLAFSFEEIPLSRLGAGEVEIRLPAAPRGDTLTVIQKPLPNIPTLLCAGDTLEIFCRAPENVNPWTVGLCSRGEVLEITPQAEYVTSIALWRLRGVVPPPPFFGPWNLVVSAPALAADTVWRAVQLLPEIPADFYFAQITDTHLPTHIFHEQPGGLTDTSAMTDLHEVLADLDIINPAFIIHTGDLVNEGELEDYLLMRVFSRAQRILRESRVPIFLVAGNHDLGGWVQTPPPAGTARRDWWRFFGWSWLNDPPPGAPWFTQNYSFRFSGVHFTLLEAYDNYDGWRYEIYGPNSFTPGQLSWLNQDLEAAPPGPRVLAFHYDFGDQVDLDDLGVDLALWGHIHQDSGSLDQAPWNLATNNVCDGERSFRLIRVENGQLQPLPTLSAGSQGEMLSVEYTPANDGSADSVAARVINNYDLEFPEALLRFVLPAGATDPEVTGGNLFQVLPRGDFREYQVQVDLPAQATVEVTIHAEIRPCLEIRIQGDQVVLSWSAVPGARGYRIYAAARPWGEFAEVTDAGVFTGTEWRTPRSAASGFYRVTARLDP